MEKWQAKILPRTRYAFASLRHRGSFSKPQGNLEKNLKVIIRQAAFTFKRTQADLNYLYSAVHAQADRERVRRRKTSCCVPVSKLQRRCERPGAGESFERAFVLVHLMKSKWLRLSSLAACENRKSLYAREVLGVLNCGKAAQGQQLLGYRALVGVEKAVKEGPERRNRNGDIQMGMLHKHVQ
ncbi:hypothetical protein C8J57DRAFT_1244145 [Mycena rebaudengoi]|nr:hypothetical protein C8J57DRAFT_1244145 [Mycena rebaudengoi]